MTGWLRVVSMEGKTVMTEFSRAQYEMAGDGPPKSQ